VRTGYTDALHAEVATITSKIPAGEVSQVLGQHLQACRWID
jgi:hypothetical protein